jgi:VIT1/CCC1 family predicted Fe2+/Mn2+ transporter
VDGAITTAGSILARLGASLQQMEGLRDFSLQLSDSLSEGLGALVDADLAEESARLTSLQTRQQLARQSLDIANQQNQSYQIPWVGTCARRRRAGGRMAAAPRGAQPSARRRAPGIEGGSVTIREIWCHC